ncbi:MAG: terminase large subunit domain-containing protein, partial [Candidatus Thorarchaeota archaeon]
MSSVVRTTPEIPGSVRFQLFLWYKDPVLFFREVFKLEPYSYQKRILKEFRNLKRIMISSASDSGKTFLLSVIALWSSLVKSFIEGTKYQVVILSGSREQAERLYQYIREALMSSEVLYPLVVKERGKPKILKSYVEFINGSWIKTFARALTSIQGVHAQMVIVDEAALKELDFFIKDTLRIVPEDGVIILSSSPHEYNCEFVRRWEDKTNYPEYDPKKCPDGWRRYHWSADECPRTRKKLEEAKALDEETFSIYYEGKPYSKDPNKVVPIHLIRRQS